MIGFDLPAMLQIADATGAPRPLMAEILGRIEDAVMAKINAQGSSDDG